MRIVHVTIPGNAKVHRAGLDDDGRMYGTACGAEGRRTVARLTETDREITCERCLRPRRTETKTN